jgi:prolyl-tRNA synthetase
MLEVYREFVETELAIPVYAGKKSDAERFAGAQDTYTIEALMKDGKALQAGTSHHLGQHFAKVFDITYQDEQGKRQFVWQTSWGATTRLVGALVMTHGDDQGLRLPPNVAPIQAVVVPIWRKAEDRSAVQAFVAKVKEAVGGVVRLHVDDRDQYTPGWKYNEYEMRGVPVRLEVGPKDVANAAVMTVRRDTRAKVSVPLAELATRLPEILADVQKTLFEQARAFRDQNTVIAASRDEVIAHFNAEKRGFVAVAWDGSADFEAQVKEQCGATLRCMPSDLSRFGSLERPGHRVALFARAY